MVAGTIRPSDRVIELFMIPDGENMPSLKELDERAKNGETVVGLDDPALRGEYERRYYLRRCKPESIRRFR